jgi:hypothetical protein
MFHAKTVDGRGVVIADFLLLGIEANALTDDGLVRFAGCAPYGEWHLESDDEGAFCVEVACACAEGVFAGELVC